MTPCRCRIYSFLPIIIKLEGFQVFAECRTQFLIIECEFDGRLQKSEFVACIVPLAVELIGEYPLTAQHAPESVC